VVNPPTRPLAGLAPWWVLLETRGWRSGKVRRTPLARGPIDAHTVWLIAVHGRNSGWVRNIEASPAVRIRIKGRWQDGRAAIQPYDVGTVLRFNRYAQAGPRTFGVQPLLIRIQLQGAC
jgi:deazaflavin-dependent oxidoreductase (nitroreductase family)